MINYPLLLLLWIVLATVLWALMRFIPAKMKSVDSPRSKSNLFFIMLLFGIPIFFALTLVPIILISGDENMPVNYKYIFIGVVAAYLIFVAIFRKKKPAR